MDRQLGLGRIARVGDGVLTVDVGDGVVGSQSGDGLHHEAADHGHVNVLIAVVDELGLDLDVAQRGIGSDALGGQAVKGGGHIRECAILATLPAVGRDGQGLGRDGEGSAHFVRSVVLGLAHVGRDDVLTDFGGSLVSRAADVVAGSSAVNLGAVVAFVGERDLTIVPGGIIFHILGRQRQNGMRLHNGVDAVGHVAGRGSDLDQITTGLGGNSGGPAAVVILDLVDLAGGGSGGNALQLVAEQLNGIVDGDQRADSTLVHFGRNAFVLDHIDGLDGAALVVILVGSGDDGVHAQLVHGIDLFNAFAVVIIIGDFVVLSRDLEALLIDQVDLLSGNGEVVAGELIGGGSDGALDLAALDDDLLGVGSIVDHVVGRVVAAQDHVFHGQGPLAGLGVAQNARAGSIDAVAVDDAGVLIGQAGGLVGLGVSQNDFHQVGVLGAVVDLGLSDQIRNGDLALLDGQGRFHGLRGPVSRGSQLDDCLVLAGLRGLDHVAVGVVVQDVPLGLSHGVEIIAHVGDFHIQALELAVVNEGILDHVEAVIIVADDELTGDDDILIAVLRLGFDRQGVEAGLLGGPLEIGVAVDVGLGLSPDFLAVLHDGSGDLADGRGTGSAGSVGVDLDGLAFHDALITFVGVAGVDRDGEGGLAVAGHQDVGVVDTAAGDVLRDLGVGAHGGNALQSSHNSAVSTALLHGIQLAGQAGDAQILPGSGGEVILVNRDVVQDLPLDVVVNAVLQSGQFGMIQRVDVADRQGDAGLVGEDGAAVDADDDTVVMGGVKEAGDIFHILVDVDDGGPDGDGSVSGLAFVIIGNGDALVFLVIRTAGVEGLVALVDRGDFDVELGVGFLGNGKRRGGDLGLHDAVLLLKLSGADLDIFAVFAEIVEGNGAVGDLGGLARGSHFGIDGELIQLVDVHVLGGGDLVNDGNGDIDVFLLGLLGGLGEQEGSVLIGNDRGIDLGVVVLVVLGGLQILGGGAGKRRDLGAEGILGILGIDGAGVAGSAVGVGDPVAGGRQILPLNGVVGVGNQLLVIVQRVNGGQGQRVLVTGHHAVHSIAFFILDGENIGVFSQGAGVVGQFPGDGGGEDFHFDEIILIFAKGIAGGVAVALVGNEFGPEIIDIVLLCQVGKDPIGGLNGDDGQIGGDGSGADALAVGIGIIQIVAIHTVEDHGAGADDVVLVVRDFGGKDDILALILLIDVGSQGDGGHLLGPDGVEGGISLEVGDVAGLVDAVVAGLGVIGERPADEGVAHAGGFDFGDRAVVVAAFNIVVDDFLTGAAFAAIINISNGNGLADDAHNSDDLIFLHIINNEGVLGSALSIHVGLNGGQRNAVGGDCHIGGVEAFGNSDDELEVLAVCDLVLAGIGIDGPAVSGSHGFVGQSDLQNDGIHDGIERQVLGNRSAEVVRRISLGIGIFGSEPALEGVAFHNGSGGLSGVLVVLHFLRLINFGHNRLILQRGVERDGVGLVLGNVDGDEDISLDVLELDGVVAVRSSRGGIQRVGITLVGADGDGGQELAIALFHVEGDFDGAAILHSLVISIDGEARAAVGLDRVGLGLPDGVQGDDVSAGIIHRDLGGIGIAGLIDHGAVGLGRPALEVIAVAGGNGGIQLDRLAPGLDGVGDGGGIGLVAVGIHIIFNGAGDGFELGIDHQIAGDGIGGVKGVAAAVLLGVPGNKGVAVDNGVVGRGDGGVAGNSLRDLLGHVQAVADDVSDGVIRHLAHDDLNGLVLGNIINGEAHLRTGGEVAVQQLAVDVDGLDGILGAVVGTHGKAVAVAMLHGAVDRHIGQNAAGIMIAHRHGDGVDELLEGADLDLGVGLGGIRELIRGAVDLHGVERGAVGGDNQSGGIIALGNGNGKLDRVVLIDLEAVGFVAVIVDDGGSIQRGDRVLFLIEGNGDCVPCPPSDQIIVSRYRRGKIKIVVNGIRKAVFAPDPSDKGPAVGSGGGGLGGKIVIRHDLSGDLRGLRGNFDFSGALGVKGDGVSNHPQGFQSHIAPDGGGEIPHHVGVIVRIPALEDIAFGGGGLGLGGRGVRCNGLLRDLLAVAVHFKGHNINRIEGQFNNSIAIGQAGHVVGDDIDLILTSDGIKGEDRFALAAGNGLNGDADLFAVVGELNVALVGVFQRDGDRVFFTVDSGINLIGIHSHFDLVFFPFGS